jgi:ABC-type transporter Mla subunit MlaD
MAGARHGLRGCGNTLLAGRWVHTDRGGSVSEEQDANGLLDKAKEVVDELAERSKPLIDRAVETAGELAEKAKPTLEQAREKAEPALEKAKPVIDRAGEVADELLDKAREMLEGKRPPDGGTS